MIQKTVKMTIGLLIFWYGSFLLVIEGHWIIGIIMTVVTTYLILALCEGKQGVLFKRDQLLRKLLTEQPSRLTTEERQVIEKLDLSNDEDN